MDTAAAVGGKTQEKEEGDPVKLLAQYENRAAQLAAEYEANMVRF